MILIRVSKIVILFSVAALFLMTFINNLADYNSNFNYVQNILRMNSLYPGNTLLGRAIDNDSVHHLVYWAIMGIEGTVSVLVSLGGVQLVRHLRGSAQEFNSSKGVAALGFGLGLFLMVFGFMVVGGEWFMMWQSEKWGSGLNSAARVVLVTGIAYLSLLMPDV
jgi:predicted small integral membrane protein